MTARLFLSLRCAALICAAAAGSGEAQELTGRKFIIDAGHGGVDPGAVGIDGGAYPNEEDFVLEVTTRLRARLQQAGAAVLLTRDADEAVSLTTRRDLANAEDPDAFISIHCNSFSSSDAHGTETFWWTSGDAADQRLATVIQNRQLQFLGRTNRGVKTSNFTVTTSSPPACLGEMLFISNAEEFAIMNSESGKAAGTSAYFFGALDFVNVTAPAVPAAVTGTPVSSTRIDLSWTDTSGLEEGFRVEQAPSASGPWTLSANVPAGIVTAQINGLSRATSYWFRVRAEHSILADSAWSQIQSVTTQNGAPVFTAPPVQVIVNPGQTAGFTAAVSGQGPITWQWLKNGSPLTNGGRISGAGTASLVITGAQMEDAGWYSVRASNTFGPAVSAAAQLVVASPAAPAGTGGGLRAHIFDNPDFTSLKRSRLHPAIDFDWGAGSPSSTTAADSFSVRWTGEIEPRYSQSHVFHLQADDAARLLINGQLVIDRWQTGPGESTSAPVELTAGKRVAVQVDYREDTGNAGIQLRWSAPSLAREVVPQLQLYRPLPQFAAGDLGVSEIAGIGRTIRLHALVPSWDQYLSAEPIADFEDLPADSASGTVLFQKPGYSGSTSAFLDVTGAAANETTVSGTLPTGNRSARALRASWSFNTGAVSPWLRLTTFNTPVLPNPLIGADRQLWLDLHASRQIRAALGVRETNAAASAGWGSDGGTAGPIEFAGVTSVQGTRPQPVRLVSANAWTTLRFDLPRESIRNFFNGNGVLESTTGRAALEHLALVPDGWTGPCVVHVDNLVVVEPNRLTWSLAAGAPVGVALDPATGQIAWTPAAGVPPGTYTFTVIVTDAGVPAVSASRSVTVNLMPLPALSVSLFSPGVLRLEWPAIAGKRYQVQHAATTGGPWQMLGAEIIADGPAGAVNDTLSGERKFYRLLLLD